jgi:putative nucleotidyltransferase with HDIG domain
MPTMKKNVISVEQLQVGIYVHLDVGWMDHPFTFNNFKIQNKEQLKTIRRLGLDSVRWDPARSDKKPLPKRDEQSQKTAKEDETENYSDQEVVSLPPEFAQQMAEKQARIQRLAGYRKNIAAVEEAFLRASSIAQKVNQTILSQPKDAINEAEQLVYEMVTSLTSAPEFAIQVISGKPGAEKAYSHALNVSVLAICLARESNLPTDQVSMIGLGAMLHDIGLFNVPEKVLRNRGVLSDAEKTARKHHCKYGLDIGKRAKLPESVLNIIYQHHELFDGSGYPQGLKGNNIDEPAQLVAIVNHYDNLCNPPNPAQALTPHEALSKMFAHQRANFNPKILQAFIRFMGVYPPGTLVSLSNEYVGMVIKVYPSHPLRSTLILYDADVPKNEAIILDLSEEPDINISKTISPAQLPPAVFDYLSPLRRISYYFDTSRS